MTSPTDDFRLLADNAFDFLGRAIAEFKSAPKFSIIHFYAALELFLKARLIEDHWSLVVAKEPDRKRFENGDFVSVSFELACDRLSKVVQSPVPDVARLSFDKVRKHRNQMVHFHHPIQGSDAALIGRVAEEQLHAWYHLHKLLTKQWGVNFALYNEAIADIEMKLSEHREFYAAKFADLASEIEDAKKSGIQFSECSVCRFVAAQHSQRGAELTLLRCRVCGLGSAFMTLECEQCEEESGYYGADFDCENCEHTEDQDSVADRLNAFVVTKDNYFEAPVPANCTWCDGYHSVIEYGDGYLCVGCLDWSEHVEACGFCNEFSNGDMSDSSWAGCGHCDGRSGWERD